MSLDKQIWLPVVQDNLFEGRDELAAIATNDNIYVVTAGNGIFHKVYIPQAGDPGQLIINPTEFPLQVSERIDDVLEYQLDHLAMPAKRLGKFDLDKLSYDKMASVINDKYGRMGEGQLYKTFNNWYIGKETGKHVETSGANAVGHAPAATGNRKKLVVDDVEKAANILDMQLIPQSERTLLLDSTMFYQLYNDIRTGNHNIRIIEKDGLQMLSEPILGFNIVKKSRVIYTTANGTTVRDIYASGAATDIAVGLALHKSAVTFADGDFEMYVDERNPLYLGGIMSAETWIGGKYRRKDKKGVVPILHATP